LRSQSVFGLLASYEDDVSDAGGCAGGTPATIGGHDGTVGSWLAVLALRAVRLSQI
jgi:hypothetical protein